MKSEQTARNTASAFFRREIWEVFKLESNVFFKKGIGCARVGLKGLKYSFEIFCFGFWFPKWRTFNWVIDTFIVRVGKVKGYRSILPGSWRKPVGLTGSPIYVTRLSHPIQQFKDRYRRVRAVQQKEVDCRMAGYGKLARSPCRSQSGKSPARYYPIAKYSGSYRLSAAIHGRSKSAKDRSLRNGGGCRAENLCRATLNTPGW